MLPEFNPSVNNNSAPPAAQTLFQTQRPGCPWEPSGHPDSFWASQAGAGTGRESRPRLQLLLRPPQESHRSGVCGGAGEAWDPCPPLGQTLFRHSLPPRAQGGGSPFFTLPPGSPSPTPFPRPRCPPGGPGPATQSELREDRTRHFETQGPRPGSALSGAELGPRWGRAGGGAAEPLRSPGPPTPAPSFPPGPKTEARSARFLLAPGREAPRHVPARPSSSLPCDPRAPGAAPMGGPGGGTGGEPSRAVDGRTAWAPPGAVLSPRGPALVEAPAPRGRRWQGRRVPARGPCARPLPRLFRPRHRGLLRGHPGHGERILWRGGFGWVARRVPARELRAESQARGPGGRELEAARASEHRVRPAVRSCVTAGAFPGRALDAFGVVDRPG